MSVPAATADPSGSGVREGRSVDHGTVTFDLDDLLGLRSS
jgi:hypothetical protein